MRNETDVLIAGLLILLGVIGFIVALDFVSSDEVSIGTGRVVEKRYESSHSSTSTSWISDSKGEIQPVFTNTYEPERWIVLVSIKGDTKAIKCNSRVWSGLEVGSYSEVKELRGKLFNYGYRL